MVCQSGESYFLAGDVVVRESRRRRPGLGGDGMGLGTQTSGM
jgi:hypothetical protein